jgi:signal transduction histidine kinase
MNGWKSGVIVLGLLGLLTYAFLQSRGPAPQLYQLMHHALKTFEVHDAELNREVLLARAGLLPHYDTMSQAIDGLYEVMDSFRFCQVKAQAAATDLFRQRLAALEATVQRKEQLTSYFQADNALMQNSLMYVLRAGRNLHRQAAPHQPRLASSLGLVSHAMLGYLSRPHDQMGGDIAAALASLPNIPQLQQDLDTLKRHGELIQRVAPQVDASLHAILQSSTSEQARSLWAAFMQHYRRLEARAQIFRWLLYGGAVVLLAYLVYVFARLRSHARALSRANDDLRQSEAARRQQEAQLLQASKMTALGTLVAGVAHEINNPNHLVLMNAHILAECWRDVDPILETHYCDSGDFALGGLMYSEMRDSLPSLIDDVRDGALRIDRIVNDLKDFARPRQESQHSEIQLNDAVQRALNLMQHQIRKATSRFESHLSDALPALLGDRQHLEQVVINLLVNALEAIPTPDSRVQVTTGYDVAQDCLFVDVQDEGVGIPQAHLERLCEPFFTTKQEQGGTGLGLAMTYTLVRHHGGDMMFTSAPGAGTRVRVTLPCASHRADSPDAAPLPDNLWREAPLTV